MGFSALLFSVSLLQTPFTVLAKDYSDTGTHWAKSEISRWSDKGILVGDNNQFRPNGNITRGELAVILNKIMNYQRVLPNDFTDLDDGFYTDALKKANTAGILVVSGTEVRPKEAVSRQEAAVMIAKALHLEPTGLPKFSDNDQIADWAMGYIGAMQSKGFISGYEGNFNPNSTITRAETVKILDMMIAEIYNQPGLYSISTDKAVIINTSGVTIENAQLSGGIVISEGVGDGDAALLNVQATGTTFINGGGENTVKANNSQLSDVIINSNISSVRLLTDDESAVKHVSAATPATLEGQFQSVDVSADTTVKGSIDTLIVSGKSVVDIASGAVGSITSAQLAADAKIVVSNEAIVKNMILNATATVNVQGQVDKITVEKAAINTNINGDGKVNSINVNASNINIATKGSSVSTGADVSNVTNNGKTLSPGTNNSGGFSKGSGSSSGGSSSSSSGSSSTTKPITITSVESVKNGLVRVTLSSSTSKALTANAFSIICTGAGKDMTVLQAHTTDNRTYDIITAYYNDNTYNLEVTLPDGERVNKDFVCKYLCPAITFPKVVRSDKAFASFTFVSDMPGTVYYGLVQNSPSLSRSFVIYPNEPTVEELMKTGQSQPMELQYNKIDMEGLLTDIGYTLYYVAQGNDGTVTPLKSMSISPKPDKLVTTSDNPILSAKAIEQIQSDFMGEHYRFEVTFQKPTEEALTVNNFVITCPASGNVSLGRATTTDNKTYKIYMQGGTILRDNNTFEIVATMPDQTISVISIYVDLTAPDTNNMQIVLDKDGIGTFTFFASEAGKLYYKIKDDVEQSTAVKPSKEIYENGVFVPITYGQNELKLENLTAGKWFCYSTEDKRGNRQPYYWYDKIPAYVPPVEPEEPDNPVEPDDPKPEKLAIESVSAYENNSGKPEMLIIFNREDVEIEKLDGNCFSLTNASDKKILYVIERTNDKKKIKLIIQNALAGNIQIPVGEHKLTVTLGDASVSFTFSTTEPIPQTETEPDVTD